METKIKQQAESLYDLAIKANLVTSNEFDKIFPESTLSKISENLNKDRMTFLQNSRTVENPGKLWDEGVSQRIMENVSQIFVDALQEKSKAFMLEYDQPVEDIVFNFKAVFSNLDISDTGEEKIEGEWYEGMKIGEELYKYKAGDGALVQDVLYDIGRKLFSLSKGILQTNFGDQNQYLVVDSDLLPEFEELGFLSV